MCVGERQRARERERERERERNKERERERERERKREREKLAGHFVEFLVYFILSCSWLDILDAALTHCSHPRADKHLVAACIMNVFMLAALCPWNAHRP